MSPAPPVGPKRYSRIATDMFRLLLEYARVMDPERDAMGDQVPAPGHA